MSQRGTKKSRRGCQRCKLRRVKCDEQAPCNNCVRRGEDCSLLEPSPSNSEPQSDPALPTNADEWIDDLALLRHYTMSTALETTGSRPGVHLLWRDYIPQQAAKHPFLMHGLLALSALHLASRDPEQALKYGRLCDRHQAVALAKYRATLARDVEPDSADALFAFASTISVSSMGRSCSPIMMETEDTITVDAVVELLYLTRGVRDVISLCHEHLKSGPMAEMLAGHNYDAGTVVDLPPPVTAHFASLSSLIATSPTLSPTAKTDCTSALTHLSEIYKTILYFAARAAPIEVGHIWRWPTGIPSAFLQLVQKREPVALVVIAHFAAATTVIRTAWYTENWGTYCLRGVEGDLDPEFRRWLEWPLEQARRGMDVLGVEADGDDGLRPLIGY